MSPTVHRAFALLATIAVIASVGWGFVVAGTPDARRTERMDERRLEALMAIQQEIQELVVAPERPPRLRAPLPKDLDELASRAKNRKIEALDPETGAPYGYRVLSETSYELCATFARSRAEAWRVFWNHAAGRQCFRVDVLDPPP